MLIHYNNLCQGCCEANLLFCILQDTEIIDQIDRDVKRTHPDMHFFSGDSQFAKSNQVLTLFVLEFIQT